MDCVVNVLVVVKRTELKAHCSFVLILFFLQGDTSDLLIACLRVHVLGTLKTVKSYCWQLHKIRL